MKHFMLSILLGAALVALSAGCGAPDDANSIELGSFVDNGSSPDEYVKFESIETRILEGDESKFYFVHCRNKTQKDSCRPIPQFAPRFFDKYQFSGQVYSFILDQKRLCYQLQDAQSRRRVGLVLNGVLFAATFIPPLTGFSLGAKGLAALWALRATAGWSAGSSLVQEGLEQKVRADHPEMFSAANCLKIFKSLEKNYNEALKEEMQIILDKKQDKEIQVSLMEFKESLLYLIQYMPY